MHYLNLFPAINGWAISNRPSRDFSNLFLERSERVQQSRLFFDGDGA
jgi:hypothetical protein